MLLRQFQIRDGVRWSRLSRRLFTWAVSVVLGLCLTLGDAHAVLCCTATSTEFLLTWSAAGKPESAGVGGHVTVWKTYKGVKEVIVNNLPFHGSIYGTKICG